jgi:acetyl esterase
VGTLELAEPMCRALAVLAGCVVVSPEYRLAPEHRFPAALDDACAVTEWVARGGLGPLAARDRLAVGGESAGGNLAAAVALRSRDEDGPKILFQLLLYPPLAFEPGTASYRQCANGYGLTAEAMRWCWGHYLSEMSQGRLAYVSPCYAPSLENLPATLIVCPEFDILRDEGAIFAERLQAEGGQAYALGVPGQIHGFVHYGGHIDEGFDALREAAIVLRAALQARAGAASAVMTSLRDRRDLERQVEPEEPDARVSEIHGPLSE